MWKKRQVSNSQVRWMRAVAREGGRKGCWCEEEGREEGRTRGSASDKDLKVLFKKEVEDEDEHEDEDEEMGGSAAVRGRARREQWRRACLARVRMNVFRARGRPMS